MTTTAGAPASHSSDDLQAAHQAPQQLHDWLMESMTSLLPDGFDVEEHSSPR